MDELAARRALRDHVAEFWRACSCADCRAELERQEAANGVPWWSAGPRIYAPTDPPPTDFGFRIIPWISKP